MTSKRIVAIIGYMSAMPVETPTSIRLPPDILDRVDKLVEKLHHLPEFALTRASRSAVLRLAVLRGLDALEQEAKRHK